MTRSLVLAAALAVPVPALALTPEELWASWQEMAASFGGTIEATATPEADGALRLSGFMAGAEGGATIPLMPDSPADVVLRPGPDGTVEIDMSAFAPLLDDMPGAELILDAPRLLARDAEGGIACELSAARLGGSSVPSPDTPPMGDFAAEVLAPLVTFPCGVPADGRYEVALSTEGFAYLTSSGPEAFMPSSQASRIEGPMSLALGVVLPPLEMLQAIDAPQDVVAALDAGLAVDARFENGPVQQSDWSEGFLPFQTTMTTSPGTSELTLDRSGLVVTGAYEEGGEGTFTSPELPVGTVEYGYGRTDVDMRIPFGPGPGELRYRVALEEVTVGEPVWALVDPEGALPRDPARMVLDIGGTMTVDLPAIVATMDDAMTGMAPAPEAAIPQIELLEIRELDVSLAGVTLGGEGSFTFETLDGVPSPIGTATIRLDGLDRLLDTVAEMGWATPEDVRNMRLGLAAMFRAGEGPDTRVSQIEAQAGGAILVNGVRMN